jgi:phenylpropionate dioxygenase-like ring-hydroxylating dioxygenase large terminal subunit
MSQTLRAKLDLFDPTPPLDRAKTIPSVWYTDQEIYDAECRAVFGASWQMVARRSQLEELGSFVTADVAGEPIVLVRGGEPGEPGKPDPSPVQGFYNVCRHRAACVVCKAAGHATRFRCPYHGWTYDLAGRLIGTPEFDGVKDFQRTDNGLVPISTATCGPFVWANLSQTGTSLLDFLQPLPKQTERLGLDSLRFAERTEYTLNCNWKVFVDNYLDGGYHVNSVHPGLAGVLDYSEYRTEISGNTAVQISPLRSTSNALASSSASVRDLSVSQVRMGDTAHYWWVFPNLMLNIYSGVMDTNLVLPLGPDRCRVIFDYYFADTDSPAAQQFITQSINVADQIQKEDVSICEQVQRGLLSRSYSTGRFSVRREAAGYHFHRLLAKYLRDGSESSSASGRCGPAGDGVSSSGTD